MYGNTILKKKASKVKKGDIDIKKLSEDMFCLTRFAIEWRLSH